jgi:hypothetical protein
MGPVAAMPVRRNAWAVHVARRHVIAEAAEKVLTIRLKVFVIREGVEPVAWWFANEALNRLTAAHL